MALAVLTLAYFLPGVCMRGMRAGRQKAGKPARQIETQTAVQEQSFSESGEPDGNAYSPEQPSGKGTIVLDPGHGGADPGMIGIGGIEEKKINLELALTLKTLLEKQGYQVVMTREADNGLYDAEISNKKAQDMQRRCAVIEETKPLLTVSIHQNSYTDPSVYGPQVFYYQHSDEGKKLAECVQEQLNTKLEIANPRKIKANTNYYILRRSQSITILAECVFLSNPEETEKIQTKEYQEAVAQAICSGILAYLNE